MDYAGIGLALVSMALFLTALVFSTRPGRADPVDKEKLSVSGETGAADGQKAVIVKLPGGDNLPDEYIIDLKVSINKNKRPDPGEVKPVEAQGKKINRLDKYL